MPVDNLLKERQSEKEVVERVRMARQRTLDVRGLDTDATRIERMRTARALATQRIAAR
jgi:hypothetical protein